MASENNTNKVLSAGVKGMKFMTRALPAGNIVENLTPATAQAWGLHHNILPSSTDSYLPFLNTGIAISKSSLGRRSVGGFNKEIELLHLDNKSDLKEGIDDVSDEEMVRIFKSNSSFDMKKRHREVDIVGDDTKNRSKAVKTLSSTTETDWSQYPGRQATRFAAGKFVRTLD
jgi:hypothetical protein